MIFSKTSEYAIRALGFLAETARGGPVGAGEVGRRTGVPAAYVAKIFQGLARAGILSSERGVKGGYRFRRAPSSVSLFDIVKVTDDLSGSALSGCVMGFRNCSDRRPCALHPAWAAGREGILKALKAASILEASKSMRKRTFRKERRRMLSRPFLSLLKPV